MLHRLGSKNTFARNVYKHFPSHQVFMSMFFGAGGLYFNKPLAKYNILNDADNDVFNLWDCVENRNDELRAFLGRLVLHESLFSYWVKNKEIDPIRKAVRFLFLSNFSYLGKQDTFQLLHSNSLRKQKLIDFIEIAQLYFSKAIFRCVDFKFFFDGLPVGKAHVPKEKRFVYADPPFVGCSEMYGVKKWTKNDRIDLVDLLNTEGYRFALSENRTDETEAIAKDYGWQIISIGHIQRLNRKNDEILIVNYDLPKTRQGGLFK